MKKHLQAIPKDLLIRKIFPIVTATEAQLIYQTTFIEKKDFICATKNCSAPLTCKLIDKPEATAFFIEQVRKENLHIPSCDFSNRNDPTPKKQLKKEPNFSIEMTGNYIGVTPRNSFNTGLGTSYLSDSIGTSNSSTTTSISGTSESKSKTNRSRNSSTNVVKRKYNKQIKNIYDAVTMFENNPDEIVLEWFLGHNLPIKKYFRTIKSNREQNKYNDDVPIYFGRGFIVNNPNITMYRFNFGDTILFKDEEKKLRPHFYVDKPFIDECFPFLKDRALNEPNKPFRIYIRARFYLSKSEMYPYHNLLNFNKFDDELLNNIYFSEK